MRLTVETVVGAALVLVFISWSGRGVAQESHIGTLVGNANRGKALYTRYCVFCHGERGDGRGESAPYLDPKPRDFTKAQFICKSTPENSLPLDSDLYDTITRGIRASGMPPWRSLLDQERADLVAYIKTFSSAFKEQKPAPAVTIPPETPDSSESIKHGAELFQGLNCWRCHGADGRGHGPFAATLKDSSGFSVMPFDFSSGKQLKCGSTDQDMFRDLVTGLDGTPMPSFVSNTTADQRWDLVHYVRTFSNTKAHLATNNDGKGQ